MTDTEFAAVFEWAQCLEQQRLRDRGMELPSHILCVLSPLLREHAQVTIGQICKEVVKTFGEFYEAPLTAKAVGVSVRNVLQLRTTRINGRYCVPRSESEKVELLAKRFGV